jgi:hypothetical protein
MPLRTLQGGPGEAGDRGWDAGACPMASTILISSCWMVSMAESREPASRLLSPSQRPSASWSTTSMSEGSDALCVRFFQQETETKTTLS